MNEWKKKQTNDAQSKVNDIYYTQGLCTCHFLCVECCSPTYHVITALSATGSYSYITSQWGLWVSYLYLINQHKLALLMLLNQRILALLHNFLRSPSGERRHSGQGTNNFPSFHQEGHGDVFRQLSGTTEYLLGGGFMSIIYWQAWFNFFPIQTCHDK